MENCKTIKLLTAGPVTLRREVSEALAEPVIAHRGPKFESLLMGIEAKLKKAFDTKDGFVALMTGSGALAVESMVFSMLDPGERVLYVCHGEFGNRMLDSMNIRGAQVKTFSEKNGRSVKEETVAAELESGKYDTLAMAYTETSVGLAYRYAERLAARAKDRGMRVIVDAVAAMFGEHISLDRSNFDAIASCSQKCVAAPAGMSFVGLNSEAEARIHSTKQKPRYLNLGMYKDAMDRRRGVPNTPAVNTMYALDKALSVMLDAGMDDWIEQHRRRAGILYEKMPRIGYTPIVENEDCRSNSVTAFRIPDRLTPAQVMAAANEGGFDISSGLGELSASVIRIGTMGDVSESDMNAVVDALSQASGQ